MKLYTLKKKQVLPISLADAWDFFSNPGNLATITPPDLKFELLYASGNGFYAGQIIKYQIQILPVISSLWVSEITNVHRPFSFVDEQRLGPYRFWYHQHHFRALDAGTEIIDEVNYAVPLGIIGRLAHRLFVGRELTRIFDYRASKLSEFFPSS